MSAKALSFHMFQEGREISGANFGLQFTPLLSRFSGPVRFCPTSFLNAQIPDPNPTKKETNHDA